MIPSVQDRAVGRLQMALHLLFVATDTESDPKAKERQMSAILSVQQVIDSLTEAPAVSRNKVLEDFSPRPHLSSQDVLEAMPEGVWLHSVQVASLIDWNAYQETKYGGKVDVVHCLNHLARKGRVERDPPIAEGRRSHNTSWRRI